MSTSLPAVVLVAMTSAATLVFAGAIFGVCIARILWAEDLKHAIRIDEIRSQTEQHLRGQIESQKQQIEILEEPK